MSSIKLVLLSITGILILSSLLSGCNSDSDSEIYWFRDPVGFFHTNDLERAQEEIPFTIILPTYPPEDMGLSTLKIYGPIEIDIGDYYQGIEVDISYISGDRKIFIYEDNSEKVMQPNIEAEPVFLEINGICVLRQKAQSLSASGIEEGFSFSWNHDRLGFQARVYSINEDEAVKIVESMIKQLSNES